jgi:hypothetical protein
VHVLKVSSISELFNQSGTCCAKIGREANDVDHELAHLGRVNGSINVWLGNYPLEICRAITCDCNFIIS